MSRNKMVRDVWALESIVYRRAEERDLPQILDLQTKIFNGEQEIPAGAVGEFLKKKPKCWCAELDGAIIGAVAAWRENGGVHWGRFVTDPAYRGRRIGTQIARVSFDDLFSQGVEEIHMEAREAAVRIVCKMGGRIVGEPKLFYVGTITPVILKKSEYHR